MALTLHNATLSEFFIKLHGPLIIKEMNCFEMNDLTNNKNGQRMRTNDPTRKEMASVHVRMTQFAKK